MSKKTCLEIAHGGLFRNIVICILILALGCKCDEISHSCHEVLINGRTDSGVYTIIVDDSSQGVNVYCDQVTDGGGWLVFQRRQDGSEDFYRDWQDYRQGFGNIQSGFWLGNDYLHKVTSQHQIELRIDLADFDGEHRFAKYSSFSVAPEEDLYQLQIGKYSGDAGDGLLIHNGKYFSTKDSDNDFASGSCSQWFKGAWWYNECHTSNLNGLYLSGQHPDQSYADGVNWEPWRGYYYSLKLSEMKLRPKIFHPSGLWPMNSDHELQDVVGGLNGHASDMTMEELTSVDLTEIKAILPKELANVYAGQSYRFAGTSDSYVEIPGVDITGDYTVVAFVKGEQNGPIWQWHAPTTWGDHLWFMDNDLFFRAIIEPSISKSHVIAPQLTGRWNLVGVSTQISSGTDILFVNNEVKKDNIGEQAGKPHNTHGHWPIRMGDVEIDNRKFKGHIFCAMIFDTYMENINQLSWAFISEKCFKPCKHGTADINHKCQCDLGWDGISCDSCARGWTGPNCDICAPHFMGTECNICEIGWAGVHCDECAPHWAGQNCDQCATGWSGSKCDRCAPHFMGADCNVCEMGWAGQNCDSCAPRWAGDNCDRCVVGWGGPYCAHCDVGWTGLNCETEIYFGACHLTHGQCGGRKYNCNPLTDDNRDTCIKDNQDDIPLMIQFAVQVFHVPVHSGTFRVSVLGTDMSCEDLTVGYWTDNFYVNIWDVPRNGHECELSGGNAEKCDFVCAVESKMPKVVYVESSGATNLCEISLT